MTPFSSDVSQNTTMECSQSTTDPNEYGFSGVQHDTKSEILNSNVTVTGCGQGRKNFDGLVSVPAPSPHGIEIQESPKLGFLSSIRNPEDRRSSKTFILCKAASVGETFGNEAISVLDSFTTRSLAAWLAFALAGW